MLARLASRQKYFLARNLSQLTVNRAVVPRSTTTSSTSSSLIVKQFNVHVQRQQQLRTALGATSVCSRTYCSSNNKQGEDEDLLDSQDFIVNKDPKLPATVAVPEVWPHVPLLATHRNPVFPRFMKIMEVSSCFAFDLM